MQKTAEEILKKHYDKFVLKYQKENIYSWEVLLKDKTTLEILFPAMKEYSSQEADLAFEAGALYGSDKTGSREWGLKVTEQNQEQYINERFK